MGYHTVEARYAAGGVVWLAFAVARAARSI
jgi:hypothetical protein